MTIIKDNNGVEFKSVHDHPDVFVALDGRVWVKGLNIYTPNLTPKDDPYPYIKHPVENLTDRVHRLIAMSWKEVPENYDTLVINHKNGDTRDFSPSNLEWTTQKRNVEHAVEIGLVDTKPIYCKSPDGGIVEYSSLANMCRTLWTEGIKSGVASGLQYNDVIARDEHLISYSAESIENFRPSMSTIRSLGMLELYKDGVEVPIGVSRSIRGLDALGVLPYSRSVITKTMANHGGELDATHTLKIRFAGKLYDIKPTIALSRDGKQVIVFDPLNESYDVYSTALDAERKLGINRSAIAKRCNKNDTSLVIPGFRVTKDPDLVFDTDITDSELRLCAKLVVTYPDGSEKVYDNWSRGAAGISGDGILSYGYIRSNQNHVREKMQDRDHDIHFLLRGVRFDIVQDGDRWIAKRQ